MNVVVTYPFTLSMLDYADDESFAVTIYFLGCAHNCPDCHNAQYKEYNLSLPNVVSLPYEKFEAEVMEALQRNRTNKCVLMGGDPLFKGNIEITKRLLDRNKNIDFMIYTGHSLDYVKKNNVTGFTFLKCGLYDNKKAQKSEKTDDYIKFGSKNQVLYNFESKKISTDGIYKFKKEEGITSV